MIMTRALCWLKDGKQVGTYGQTGPVPSALEATWPLSFLANIL